MGNSCSNFVQNRKLKKNGIRSTRMMGKFGNFDLFNAEHFVPLLGNRKLMLKLFKGSQAGVMLDREMAVLDSMEIKDEHPVVQILQPIIRLEGRAVAFEMMEFHLGRYFKLLESCPHRFDGLAKSLSSGLQFLHSKGIVHCNIAPQNVLMDVVHGRHRATKYKLANFECAFHVSDDYPWTETSCQVGTGGYIAPEIILSGERHTSASDLWSMGMLLIKVLCGDLVHVLVSNAEWTKDDLKRWIGFRFDDDVASEYAEIFMPLLQDNSARRVSSAGLVVHCQQLPGMRWNIIADSMSSERKKFGGIFY